MSNGPPYYCFNCVIKKNLFVKMKNVYCKRDLGLVAKGNIPSM